jgi:dynein heavy chain
VKRFPPPNNNSLLICAQFDRDYLEFNVNISDLESGLQGFINASFENITSTEHALNLLRQFQSILQRETLKADLEDK